MTPHAAPTTPDRRALAGDAGDRAARAATRLNLGGGFRWREPGWTCLDLALGYDLGERLLGPVPDASVHAIFCSHTLEHLPVHKAADLVRDCRRVLRPGGVLRLVLPDCERVVRARNEGDASLMGDPTFAAHFTSLDQAVIAIGGDPTGRDQSAPPADRHYFFWDRFTLQWLLMWAGFKRVVVQQPGRSVLPELRRMATMDAASGFPLEGFDNPLTAAFSVYIEGVAAP